MANWKERRAELDKNSTAKIVWIVLLVLEALSAVVILIASIILASIGTSLGGVGGILTGAGLVFGILGLALVALTFWGIWRLEKWVQWLMWISVLLNITSLFSSRFYQGLLPVLVAVGYTWILRLVAPSTPTPVTPTIPTPPTAS